jgi:hypothetical protein
MLDKAHDLEKTGNDKTIPLSEPGRPLTVPVIVYTCNCTNPSIQ